MDGFSASRDELPGAIRSALDIPVPVSACDIGAYRSLVCGRAGAVLAAVGNVLNGGDDAVSQAAWLREHTARDVPGYEPDARFL
jgi:hypothetical protein